MEILPSTPMEVRVQWINLLMHLSQLRNIKNPVIFARSAEQFVHANRQKVLQIGYDVEVYRYGKIDVLDLDSDVIHHSASLSHYNNSLRKIAWMLQNGNLDEVKDKKIEQWFELHEDKITFGTGHSDWETKFFAQQELARSILSGKFGEVPKSGIFQCSKCNSFDVDTEQKQTRSADEPMTIFCTCNSCGKRFIR